MVSPTPTLMLPLGPCRMALPSKASRTVQFAIPLTSIPSFISREVCFGAAFAFASGSGGLAGFATGLVGDGAAGCWRGFATGLAIGLGDGAAVVACTTSGLTTAAAVAAAD